MQKAQKISKEKFIKILGKGKGFVPQKIKNELASAGLSGLLFKDKITKPEAFRAIQFLKEKKLLAKYSEPTDLWDQAAIEQYQDDSLARQRVVLGHTHAAILEDIGDEAIASGKLKELERFGRKAAQGRQVIDLIKKEQLLRQEAIKEARKKHGFVKPIDPLTKEITPPLDDMGIDFGN